MVHGRTRESTESRANLYTRTFGVRVRGVRDLSFLNTCYQIRNMALKYSLPMQDNYQVSWRVFMAIFDLSLRIIVLHRTFYSLLEQSSVSFRFYTSPLTRERHYMFV